MIWFFLKTFMRLFSNVQNYIAQWANIFPSHPVIDVNLYLNDNTHEYWDFVKIVHQNFTDGGFGVCVAINLWKLTIEFWCNVRQE